MLRSLQKSLTSLKRGGASGTSTGIRGAVSGLTPWVLSGWPLLKACWPMVPPLPGATYTQPTSFDRLIFQASACSAPPWPTTSTGAFAQEEAELTP